MSIGKHAPEHSFLQADGDNVVITALKKAEDDSALVLRFYEWAGTESDVKIHLPRGAESASETNLMEVSTGSLPLKNGTVIVHTKPYEIRTLKVMFAKEGREAQKTH
jgi:alpha-mannosidase